MAQDVPKVGDIMQKNVLAVPLDTTARDCSKAMAKRGVGCAVIMGGGAAAGIVTERDLVAKVIADELEPKKVLVRDIMSTPLITVSVDSPITEAAKVMAQYRVRRLVVVGGQVELLGIITTGDIARSLAEKQDFKDENLNAMARLSEKPESGPYQ